MADKKISQLDSASALVGTEVFAVVQSDATKQVSVKNLVHKYIAKAQTAQSTVAVDLDDSDYDNAKLIKLSWSGASGTVVYTLPDAASSKNTNRVIRLISDSTFSNNTKVRLTPRSGQNLDGSSSYYEINKAYEGIAIWSDGTEWFVIQKKA